MRFIRFKVKEETRIGFFHEGQIFDLILSLKELDLNKDILESVNVTPVEILAIDTELSSIISALLKRSHVNGEKPKNIYQEDEIKYLAPVSNPGKIICVGLNYPSAKNGEPIDIPKYPILFHKVSSSLTGHKGPINIPKISKAVQYEGELAIVIGKKAQKVTTVTALDYVAGFTVANDVGASDIQERNSQWTSGKMFDTFCPLGPALVTLDEIPNPDDLRISTQLNGEIVQDGRTSEMFFSVRELISYISELTTLDPGDIILTGSPKTAGDQPDPRTILKPGDLLTIEIENIGNLSNLVMAEV